jgi:hypothetical protein
MITFDQIKNANESIKTTDVKGKDYAEVHQRIKAFRSVCPNGAIVTELMSNENGVCIFKASVYDEKQMLIGTGTAYEREDSSFINKTSYIENCETSAVGRALGMCGFGIDVSVASAEEVKNAILNQEGDASPTTEPKAEPKATQKQIDLLYDLYTDAELEKIYGWAKVNNLKDLTVSQASQLISKRKGNK